MSTPLDLESEATALGVLVGLLDEGGTELNADWFHDPVSELGAIGTRLGRLVSLLEGRLGPPAEHAPDVFAGAAWYPLPNPLHAGSLTPSLVMPAGAPDDGQVGVGVFFPFAVGDLTLQAYVYLPLFTYGASGAELVAGDGEHPLHVGLYADSPGGFRVTGADEAVTFGAVRMEAGIALGDHPPIFTLHFQDLQGTARPDTYGSLDALLDPAVQSWLVNVLLRGSYWLHLYVGTSSVTLGELLAAAGFLTRNEKGEYDLALQQLQGRSGAEIATGFVFALLDGLSQTQLPLLELPGGGVYVEHRSRDGVDQYGVRVAALLALGGTPAANGAARPAIELSLGSWFTGEDDATSWMARTTGSPDHHAGLAVYLLSRAADETLSFAPSVSLVSGGLNIKGGGDAPLVSTRGVTLQGAEIRGSLDSDGWSYGFGARLNGVGFPLGPGFGATQQGGTGKNVVAGNLVASGDDPAQQGQASAVNPAFSAEAAYVKGSPALLEVFDATGARTDVLWFPVQARFGPVTVQKVGVRVTGGGDPVLDVLLDGGVSAEGLELYLDDLSVSVPLRHAAEPDRYSMDLQGLEVSFEGGGVQISGGLLKRITSAGLVEYDGEAILKAEGLALHALGSYAALPGGGTSLFIFAQLDKTIGGPAFFFVTGLAAGFGYNRSLVLPAMDQVQDFPLVAGLSDPDLPGGTRPSPGEVLASLEHWVPVARGEYWIAAGVQFTTFEVIRTNALLVVQFGAELVIAVLGVSTLRQPQEGETYVYAELGIQAVLRPGAGEFRASAVLGPNSFVLDRKARLTGGFAFYAWFGASEHAGDFAFTIGGYHPAFKPPAWYPQVPRLGICWQFDSRTALTGTAYFAITPTAMMAGGALQVTYSDGSLKAWLKASTDIIVYWKPFYLVARVSVSVGISYHLKLAFVSTTLSVELGAEFLFWGPPVGFKVHVDWHIISFTIGSGEPAPPVVLTWQEFKGMLPGRTAQPSSAAADTPGPAASPAAGTAAAPAWLYVNAASGLLRTQEVNGVTLWLVRAAQLRLDVGSAIPAVTVVVESSDPAHGQVVQGAGVGIRGVGGGIPSSDYRSTQTVTLLRFPDGPGQGLADEIAACVAPADAGCTTRPPGCTAQTADTTGWSVEPVVQNLPEALWGEPVPAGQAPDVNSSTPTVRATIGVRLAPRQPETTNCTPEMEIDRVFAGRIINPRDEYHLPLAATAAPCPDVPGAVAAFADIAHVNDAGVAAARGALFAALQTLGVNGWTNAPLARMAADPGHAFADEPMKGEPVCAGA